MRYRKKPVVVDVFHWARESRPEEYPGWLLKAVGKGIVSIYPKSTKLLQAFMIIETLEGRMTAKFGDYIIQGVHGEIYPCKPDIFEATYEKVET
jgi:hypothetical protein